MTSRYIGTNDYSFSGGESSGTDNMVKIEELEYDSGNDDGNGYLTKRTRYVVDGTTDKRETTYEYDLRGSVLLETRAEKPHAFNKYDNMNRLVASGRFSSTASITVGTDDPTTETTNRLALSQTEYDEMGRVWKSKRHEIDASDGSDDDNLETQYWYDEVGRAIKVDGEQLAKTAYDRLGRRTHYFILSDHNDSAYADADDVTGDIVLEERQTTYDTDGTVIMEAAIAREHDDFGGGETTGALDSNADSDDHKYTDANVSGRIQITGMWYDDLDRLEKVAQYGTYGGSDFDRDSVSEPSASTSTVILTKYSYDTDGSLQDVTDPRGTVTRSEYDAAGRQTKEIRNYDSGVNSGNPSGTDDNVTTVYEYTDGLRTKIKADLPAGETDQQTTYTYGTTKGASAGDSKIQTGHLLQKVQYPDSAGGTDVVTFAYNAQSELIWKSDQSGIRCCHMRIEGVFGLPQGAGPIAKRRAVVRSRRPCCMPWPHRPRARPPVPAPPPSPSPACPAGSCACAGCAPRAGSEGRSQ